MYYFLQLPCWFAFNLLAILLAPILPVFSSIQKGNINNAEREDYEPRLISLLSWFGTPDNSLLGDEGHKARWEGKSQYLQMVAWLWRNPAYTFEWSILAVIPTGTMFVVGDPWIKNRTDAVAGTLAVRFDNCWMKKSIKHLYGDLALMTEFGWRLQPWAQRRGDGKAQYVMSIRLTAFNPKKEV